jgi:hypothetical protein
MKITIVSLVAVLACSCHKVVDNPTPRRSEYTMERREDVRKIITSYVHSGIDVLRGPLTVDEVQRELTERARKTPAGGGRVIPGGPEWKYLKAQLKQGDELYFYKTDRKSWAEQRGAEGYVAIREREIIGGLLTGMN